MTCRVSSCSTELGDPHATARHRRTGFIGSNFVHHVTETYRPTRSSSSQRLHLRRAPFDLAAVADRITLVEADVCDEAAVDDVIGRYDASCTSPPNRTWTSRSTTPVSVPADQHHRHRDATCAWPASTPPSPDPSHLDQRGIRGRSRSTVATSTRTRPYSPRSPYAASKAASDHLVRAYGNRTGCRTRSPTAPTTTGTHHLPEKAARCCSSPTPSTEEDPPSTATGRCVRDYLFVTDHCRASTTSSSTTARTAAPTVRRRGTSGRVQLAQTILDLLELPHDRIEYVADRPGHDRRYAIDATRIGDELGWKPSVSFEEGIATTIRWYKTERSVGGARSRTRPGSSPGTPSEGHHPGRRVGHPPVPDHPAWSQAADAHLRQADDLLPAVDADAGRGATRS